jgi:hypothetical protein
MPAPVASINLSVTLDGREVVPGILDDAGHPAEGGRVARLKLDRELGRKPAVLEVNYHLPPSRGGVLQTVLRPPVVHGDSGQVPLRWQVTLPPLWVVLGPESGEERTWGRRGWLLAARPALTTRKLEEWFAGKDVPLPTDDDPPATPSLIVWGVSGEPLTVLHAPQQTWVLVCSLALVVLGVIGFLAARSGPDRRAAAWLWPLCILLATAAVVAALLWPTLTAAVAYGCEWGALILLIAGLVQGLLHVRYRRQIVFLPSFTRSRPGSSLLRSPVPRPHGEPSTVDAPRPGSSNWPEGEPPEGR